MFLDGPTGEFVDAVHVIFANEKVRPEYALPAPDVTQVEREEKYDVISLEALVGMKLASFRRKDQMHLLDMIRIGLVEANWPSRFPSELASRLQELIDNPDS